MALADKACGGRIVSLLEGGYDLEGLAKSASAHVDALMGREAKA
jgi:acetoin utilization deacetylase AcuC-like enzyme